MSWMESENRAYQWFKDTIDSNAIAAGKSDSVLSDIYSPLYNAYIEIKDITNGARCGQFTEATIRNNPFAQAIYDGDYSPEICKKFIQYHYTQKNVTHFIIINGNDMSFHSFDEFFTKYLFEVQNPYQKRSGTRQAPKKDIPILLNMDDDFTLEEDGRVYCKNSKRWGEYISAVELFDYFISKSNTVSK